MTQVWIFLQLFQAQNKSFLAKLYSKLRQISFEKNATHQKQKARLQNLAGNICLLSREVNLLFGKFQNHYPIEKLIGVVQKPEVPSTCEMILLNFWWIEMLPKMSEHFIIINEKAKPEVIQLLLGFNWKQVPTLLLWEWKS